MNTYIHTSIFTPYSLTRAYFTKTSFKHAEKNKLFIQKTRKQFHSKTHTAVACSIHNYVFVSFQFHSHQERSYTN